MARPTNQWEDPEPKKKKFKIFLWGPEGSYKTRVMLLLGHNPTGEKALAVIDPEFGTDHYIEEFPNIKRAQSPEADDIHSAARQIIAQPGSIKILGLDTFSIYYESLVAKYADLYLKRELRSAGHKTEYYTLQPRDYQPINREASKFVRLLLRSDLHVIVNCQQKDEWSENMKVIGQKPDGWKRLPYYFDVIIKIEKDKKNKFKAICEKDRTHHLKVGEAIPWGSAEEAAAYLEKQFGQTLHGGKNAAPVVEEQDAQAQEVVEEKQIEAVAQTEEVKTESEQAPSDKLSGILETEEGRTRLYHIIVNLKKDLRITDKTKWESLLEPFGTASVKELSFDNLKKFIGVLEELLPIDGRAG